MTKDVNKLFDLYAELVGPDGHFTLALETDGSGGVFSWFQTLGLVEWDTIEEGVEALERALGENLCKS